MKIMDTGVIMKIWQYEKTGVDGKCDLFGVNIFDYQWENTGEYANAKDPTYQRIIRIPIYRVNIIGEVHTFAAVELSNCVYGFYLFKY